jgi:hypothetical protein
VGYKILPLADTEMGEIWVYTAPDVERVFF